MTLPIILIVFTDVDEDFHALEIWIPWGRSGAKDLNELGRVHYRFPGPEVWNTHFLFRISSSEIPIHGTDGFPFLSSCFRLNFRAAKNLAWKMADNPGKRSVPAFRGQGEFSPYIGRKPRAGSFGRDRTLLTNRPREGANNIETHYTWSYIESGLKMYPVSKKKEQAEYL